MNKYEWDLECLLEHKTLEDLYQKWENKNKEIIKLYPCFYKSLANFKKWMFANESLEKLDNRLKNYLSNKLQTDLINPIWLGWMQKINLADNKFQQQTSDYENVVIKNKHLITKYLKDKSLNCFKREFDLIFRFEPHILKPEIENTLTKLSVCNGGIPHIFSILTDSDLKFKPAKDSNNKLYELNTISDVTKLLKNPDRVIRKNVWINYHSAYDQYTNTLAQTLYYTYLEFNTYAKLRNFKNYVDASAFYDEINETFITSLYKRVESLKQLHKAYSDKVKKLLCKQLKIKSYEPWDGSMDLYSNPIIVSIPEAQKITLEALSPLGKDYCSHIKEAFNQNWISWLPKKNKHTGAYSIGSVKGLNKYFILMNFDGTMSSVETLVHELGHSMHSYYASKAQKAYPDVAIFYAEIASIAAETLLLLYLINKYKNDQNLVNMYLKRFFDNFFACITRQIEFSNFEYEANKMVNNGTSFNAQSLKDLYLNILKKYEVIEQKKEKKMKSMPYAYSLSTILRIPHFYQGNFYVYKYAIGQICGLYIAYKIFKGEKAARDKFIKFLSSGSSLPPLETIKLLGIDLTKQDVYDEIITIANNLLKKLK